MRVFWGALLVVGLALVGLDAYEARGAGQTAAPSSMEDGMGYPDPYPK